jgi:hypothetical protein
MLPKRPEGPTRGARDHEQPMFRDALEKNERMTLTLPVTRPITSQIPDFILLTFSR